MGEEDGGEGGIGCLKVGWEFGGGIDSHDEKSNQMEGNFNVGERPSDS